VKTVAVKDNEVLYSKETEWDVTNPDPEYHYGVILAQLKLAKEKLPKVDAVGGSACGPVSANNEARYCDIFPNVPPDVYKEKVVHIFERLAKEIQVMCHSRSSTMAKLQPWLRCRRSRQVMS